MRMRRSFAPIFTRIVRCFWNCLDWFFSPTFFVFFGCEFLIKWISSTAEKMVRPKKFALIWWLNSHHSDVTNLSVFPKNDRFVGGISTVLWFNKKTGKKRSSRPKSSQSVVCIHYVPVTVNKFHVRTIDCFRVYTAMKL